MAMPRIEINTDWCKACYLCVEMCPRKVLEIDYTHFVNGLHPVIPAHPEKCTVCRLCELWCPDIAIAVYEAEEDA